MTRVLAIEDNAGDAYLIQHALHGLSFPVDLTVARDGEEAIRMLSDSGSGLDLIILDINIPKIDGHAVLERVGPIAAPVVVFSSTSDPNEIKRARELGAQQCFSKPGDLEEFTSVVQGMVLRYARTA
jgi:CheY-like chemotaxis protein